MLNVFGIKTVRKKMLRRHEIRWKDDTIGPDGNIGCGPDSSGSGQASAGLL